MVLPGFIHSEQISGNDAYLRSRGAELSDASRRVVNSHIDQYSGRAPIKRSDLEAFLNRRITVG